MVCIILWYIYIYIYIYYIYVYIYIQICIYIYIIHIYIIYIYIYKCHNQMMLIRILKSIFYNPFQKLSAMLSHIYYMYVKFWCHDKMVSIKILKFVFCNTFRMEYILIFSRLASMFNLINLKMLFNGDYIDYMYIYIYIYTYIHTYIYICIQETNICIYICIIYIYIIYIIFTIKWYYFQNGVCFVLFPNLQLFSLKLIQCIVTIERDIERERERERER